MQIHGALDRVQTQHRQVPSGPEVRLTLCPLVSLLDGEDPVALDGAL